MLGLVKTACLASLRHNQQHKLVSVNATFAEIFAAEELPTTVFGREHFEAIHSDRVEMWVNQSHLSHLLKKGFSFSDTEDIGAASHRDEMQRPGGRYQHTRGMEPDWSEYCGYDCMTERLAEMASVGGCTPASTFELQTIGKTIDNHDIWVVKVRPSSKKNVPTIMLAGNIHGDETTGGQLLQRWLWESCNNPSAQQQEMMSSLQVYYMPMFNPDGYERNRRGNGNNADLNRDFPLVTNPNSGMAQPESKAYVEFVKGKNIDVSMMYHGGAVVANYAYDHCYTSDLVPRPCPDARASLHARGDEVLPSTEAYSEALLSKSTRCTVGNNCVVNGAGWYQITGSLQDWAFHYNNQLDMTMEVSSTKRPSGSQLPGFYEAHKDAIYEFSMWPISKKGVKKTNVKKTNATAPATATASSDSDKVEKRMSHKGQIYIKSTAARSKYDCLTVTPNANKSRKSKDEFVISVQPCMNPAKDRNASQLWLVDGAQWIGAHTMVQSAATTAGQPCLATVQAKKTKLGMIIQRECTEGAAGQQWFFAQNKQISPLESQTQCLTAGNSPTVATCSASSQQKWLVGNVADAVEF